jgi:Trypsin-like peptidase domain
MDETSHRRNAWAVLWPNGRTWFVSGPRGSDVRRLACVVVLPAALMSLLPSAMASAAGLKSVAKNASPAKTSSSSTITQTIVPYQAIGYRSLQVPTGQEPSGWQGSSFDDSSWATGDAAFGSGGSCPLQATVKTQWGSNTDMLLRKPIPLPAGTNGVTVGVAVDNDVDVYWNGTLVGSATHEFCPAYNDFAFSVPDNLLVAGSNLLAVRGIDRGDQTFLDVTVTGNFGTGVTNAFGDDVVGQPNVQGTWILGGFDATHTVSGSEPPSCFTAPGCQIDNLSASINWGDGSAGSVGTVLCVLPVFPFPPPSSGQMHCTIQGSHTYSTRGAYAVDITFDTFQTIIRAEAQITQTPTMGEIKQSVGELVAFDSIGPTSQFVPCTATALLSVNGDVIVTAAHCVADILSGDGHVFARLKFAPGHSGPTCARLEECGTNPYGVFQADASDVTIFPDVQHKQRFDWAFVRLPPLGEGRLDQVVPGLATQFNPPTESSWLAMGYPFGKQVGPPDLGERQLFFRTCSGTSAPYFDQPPPGPSQLLIAACKGSGLTPGSSGGPWLSSVRAVGVVNKALGDPGLLGTYLGNEAQAAFLTASLDFG